MLPVRPFRYGHLGISSDERLPEMVREFVKKAVVVDGDRGTPT